MNITRRHWLGAGAAALLARALKAKALPVKIGVTDWNLRQEAKLDAVALAQRLGFDGVEISIGVGTEQLPLSDRSEERRVGKECRL